MSNKKKVWIAVVLFSVAIVAAIIVYTSLQPKLRLANKLKEMKEETYSYTVDYKIDGVKIKYPEQPWEGTIRGTKGTDLVYGRVYHENYPHLDFYVDYDMNVILNIKPLFDTMVSLAEAKTNIPLDLIHASLDDVVVSLDQIEEITGKKIITMDDAGINSELMDSVIDDSNGAAVSYDFKQLKNIDDSHKLIGDEADYFQISLYGIGTKIIVGIPQKEIRRKVSVEIDYKDISGTFIIDYKLKEIENTQVPEVTVSDKTIEVLKTVYDCCVKIVREKAKEE